MQNIGNQHDQAVGSYLIFILLNVITGSLNHLGRAKVFIIFIEHVEKMCRWSLVFIAVIL